MAQEKFQKKIFLKFFSRPKNIKNVTLKYFRQYNYLFSKKDFFENFFFWNYASPPIWKKFEIILEKFWKKIFQNFFKNHFLGAKWRFLTFLKFLFFCNFFFHFISTYDIRFHNVSMYAVWSKLKLYKTKRPYPRNVHISFLWPLGLY